MKSLFKKIEVISSSILSKKDKKTINKICDNEILKKNVDYSLVKLKNRANLILESNKALLFYFNNKYIPTIKSLENNLLTIPKIYLDAGAVSPIQRGANVMAPGIFKYINLCTHDFKKNEILCIEILNFAILAIGIALLNKNEITKSTNGEAVEIVHIKNDELYNKY
ncbi:rna-binding protein [Vairimorpha ceranae]|uniref:Rna-binding protein n=1 Tax=Vairimorpha ceranae TaxID=40302 RepID=A0A0F9ZDQ8_9MICR|nr:rna-binding protein [Vairimorpha ceranae]KAF5140436.1 hypothetical protein G9O61_00g012410 [Vairimorpha ceranae]KKO75664.1 rna-binding protein [Vairimorpha ceranae]